MSKRQQVEAVVESTAAPALAALGLEIVEVALTGPAREPTLRLSVDRPGGGVTVDELQAASTAVETALDVAEALPGRYRLEVSSPGIDRPWKRLEDFRRHAGERASIKTFAPLPDGGRHFTGRVIAVEDGFIHFAPDSGTPVVVAFSNIASARPEIDWAALLRGGKRTSGGAQGGQP
ncbi:MAG: ribosome maturation factor RimP [Candidatus Methylomirabilia bacterium]